MIKRLFCIVSVSLALISCASKPPAGTKIEFKTRITDHGLKHFQIRFLPPTQLNPMRAPQQGSEHSHARSKYSEYKKTQRQLLSYAETKMTETHFCRTDFWVLENEPDGRPPYLRGECNEQASSQDRDQFPDTILQW